MGSLKYSDLAWTLRRLGLKRMMVLGIFIVLAVNLLPDSQPLEPGEPAMAWTLVLQVVIAVAISLLLNYLLAEDDKAVIKDDKPTTLTSRGADVNYVIGIRRVGPILNWAGDRGSFKEGGGKKGGNAPEQKVFIENGMQILCVGPAFCLHRIYQQGKIIFEGPISRISHPSSSLIDLGSEGKFRIYWGEERQPLNSFLGDVDRIGVASRWPFHCYVVWEPKRLGSAPQWPLLDYVIEVRNETGIDEETTDSILVSTPGYMPPSQALTGSIGNIVAVDGAEPTINDLVLLGELRAKTQVRLAGNSGLPDQDLDLLTISFFQFEISPAIPPMGFNPGAPAKFEARATLGFEQSLIGITADGTLQSYLATGVAAVNGAHCIAKMLYGRWPQGLNYPQSGPFAPFDIPSLDALAVQLGPAGENLRCTVLGKNGDTLEQLLGGLLQDFGMLIPIDPGNGLLKFTTIREPVGVIPVLSQDMFVDGLPTAEINHGTRNTDSMVFKFPDRSMNFRDATIKVTNDGQVQRTDSQNVRPVQITSTTDYETGSKIAQRRSREELPGGTAVKLRANRAARTLKVGQAVVVEGELDVMILSGLQLSDKTGKVKLELVADAYGIPPSDFLDIQPPNNNPFLPVAPDLAKIIVEVSEYVSPGEVLTGVARIRAHQQIFDATVHFSPDNSVYTQIGIERDFQAGGILSSELSSEDFYSQEEGPIITLLGPDASTILDLSGDITNWRLGRQVAVMQSEGQVEIFFLRNITLLGGGLARLDGLLRAQYESVRLTHPAGTAVIIFDISKLLTVNDPLLIPEAALFAKTQPTSGDTLPLSSDTPTSIILYGKGQRPVPVAGVHAVMPFQSPAYRAGETVDIVWNYGTPQTPAAGAGQQAAGSAISFTPPPDGDFKIEIFVITVLVNTYSSSTPDFSYTPAQRTADGIGEINFTFRVTSRRGGLESSFVELDIENVI